MSSLCLGTWNFGSFTNEREAFRIMDAALAGGISFFDTANHYPGVPGTEGLSEQIIGRWFAQGNGRRARVTVATKVYQSMHDPLDGPNDDRGLSAYKIRRHADASLRRLGTDHIDLYQMHHVDRRTTFDEIWQAFSILTYQGKIGYVGSSNFAGWHLVKAQNSAREHGLFGLVSEQHKYNLFCRLPELEVIPAAADLGIGVIAYSPLAGGLLGGRALDPAPGTRTDRMAEAAQVHRTAIEQFSALCAGAGAREADVAVAWLLRNSAVASVVIGPRTLDQLQTSLSAVETHLDDELVAALDAVFPGPGGTAPEAYAW